MHLRSDWLSIRRLPLASNPYLLDKSVQAVRQNRR
ncbi:Uncharacterised protein [Segatella copri]|nr:Uncharacterised protein [Segatella copri]